MKSNPLTYLLAVACVAILAAACSPIATATPTKVLTPTTDLDANIARVNDEFITVKEYQAAVRYARYQLVNQYTQYAGLINSTTESDTKQYFQGQQQQIELQLNSSEELGSYVIEYLLNDHLLRQEAARRGVSVSLEEVEAQAKAMFGFAPSSALVDSASSLTPTPDPALEYASQLTAFLSDLKTRANVTTEDFFTFVESQIILEKMTLILGSDVPLTGEQVHARHILVADEATALEVLAKLAAGETWEALAAQYSTDSANAQQGGDLGWFPRGIMVESFENAAFALGAGVTSDPIQTEFGWHIIQVLERGDHPLPEDEVTNARRAATQEWLSSQLDGVDANGRSIVEVFDGWEKVTPTTPSIR